MIDGVEARFGLVNRLRAPVECCRITARPTLRATPAPLPARSVCYRSQPTIKRHGRSVCEDHHARLRAGRPVSRRGNRAPPAQPLVRRYNTVHPHKALGMSARATANAVGAWHRPHGSTTSADAIGSSPPPAHRAETRAQPRITHEEQTLSGYLGQLHAFSRSTQTHRFRPRRSSRPESDRDSLSQITSSVCGSIRCIWLRSATSRIASPTRPAAAGLTRPQTSNPSTTK